MTTYVTRLTIIVSLTVTFTHCPTVNLVGYKNTLGGLDWGMYDLVVLSKSTVNVAHLKPLETIE